MEGRDERELRVGDRLLKVAAANEALELVDGDPDSVPAARERSVHCRPVHATCCSGDRRMPLLGAATSPCCRELQAVFVDVPGTDDRASVSSHAEVLVLSIERARTPSRSAIRI